MNQPMMIRTDHTEVLRTVVLHLGNRLDVMNVEYSQCSSGITPFLGARLSCIATFDLARRAH